MIEQHQPNDARVTEPVEKIELRQGTLTRAKLVLFGISAYVPAVGMTSYPLLLLNTAGYGAALAATIALIATLFVGYTILPFARRYVGTGSLYLYVGKVFGPWARYVTAAGLMLGYLMQIATICVMTGMYLSGFFVSIGAEWGTSSAAQLVIWVVSVVLALLVSARGLDASYKVLLTITIISVPIIALVTVASGVTTGLEFPRQLSMEGATWFGIISGVAAAASGIVGFESSAALAYETKSPKRSVPLALILVPLVLGVLYILSTVFQIPGLMQSQEQIASGRSGISALAELGGLPLIVGQIADLVLAVTIFSCFVGFVNFSSRFYFGLARDGLLPAFVTRTDKRGTPVPAIVVVLGCGLALLFILSPLMPGGIVDVYTATATLIVYFWVPPYILISVAAVIHTRRARKLGIVVLLAAVGGGAIMAWLVLSALITPPPAPADAAMWVFLILMTLVSLALAWRGRKAVQNGILPDGGEDTEQLAVVTQH